MVVIRFFDVKYVSILTETEKCLVLESILRKIGLTRDNSVLNIHLIIICGFKFLQILKTIVYTNVDVRIKYLQKFRNNMA